MSKDKLDIKCVTYGRKFSADNQSPETTQGKYEPEEIIIEVNVLPGQTIDNVLKRLHTKTIEMRGVLNEIRDKYRELQQIEHSISNLEYDIQYRVDKAKTENDMSSETLKQINDLKQQVHLRNERLAELKREVTT